MNYKFIRFSPSLPCNWDIFEQRLWANIRVPKALFSNSNWNIISKKREHCWTSSIDRGCIRVSFLGIRWCTFCDKCVRTKAGAKFLYPNRHCKHRWDLKYLSWVASNSLSEWKQPKRSAFCFRGYPNLIAALSKFGE